MNAKCKLKYMDDEDKPLIVHEMLREESMLILALQQVITLCVKCILLEK